MSSWMCWDCGERVDEEDTCPYCRYAPYGDLA